MKRIASEHHASKSVVREAAWTVVSAVCLFGVGSRRRPPIRDSRPQPAYANGTGRGPSHKPKRETRKNERHEVSIDNFSFTPMEMTIPAGSQVTWANKDDVPCIRS